MERTFKQVIDIFLKELSLKMNPHGVHRQTVSVTSVQDAPGLWLPHRLRDKIEPTVRGFTQSL